MEKKLDLDAKYKISVINFGLFRLDGGSMFGSVPKNLWNKIYPCDEQNRIQLAQQSLVLRDDKRCILVDVGMGDKWNEKLRVIYAVEQAPFPIDPNEVTDIILTHLHFDHAGGISRYDNNEKLIATFPNAKVHLQQKNLEHAKTATKKEQASYMIENYSIVEKMPLNLIEGAAEILPDIFVHPINGHTKGQQVIEVKCKGDSILFPSDLIPTTRHISPAFHMGYDICAETVLQEKESFLIKATSNSALVIFQHDPDNMCGRIKRDEKGTYTLENDG